MDIGVWNSRGRSQLEKSVMESSIYKWYRLKAMGLEEVIFRVSVDRDGRRP